MADLKLDTVLPETPSARSNAASRRSTAGANWRKIFLLCLHNPTELKYPTTAHQSNSHSPAAVSILVSDSVGSTNADRVMRLIHRLAMCSNSQRPSPSTPCWDSSTVQFPVTPEAGRSPHRIAGKHLDQQIRIIHIRHYRTAGPVLFQNSRNESSTWLIAPNLRTNSISYKRSNSLIAELRTFRHGHRRSY